MSTTTEKLGLIKPELSDPANITAMNENWDKLDQLIGAQSKITFGTTEPSGGADGDVYIQIIG